MLKLISRSTFVLTFTLCMVFAQSDELDINAISLDSLLSIEISGASKFDQVTTDAPSSITVITAEDIENYGYQNLGEALNSAQGFYMSDDRNYSYLGVRGFSRPSDFNNRVQILLNGMRLNEGYYGSVGVGSDFGGLDMSEIERIEVVRGPGSSLYGSGAMFAVINIVTKKPVDKPDFYLTAGGGSFATKYLETGFSQSFDTGVEASASFTFADIGGEDLYYPEFDTPQSNNGRVSGLDWENYYSILGQVNYKNLDFQLYMYSRDKGIPTAAWDTPFNDPASFTRDAQSAAQLTYNFSINEQAAVTLRAYYLHYYYFGQYPYLDVDDNGDDMTFLSWDDNHHRNAGSEIVFDWQICKANRITTGLEYNRNFQSDYSYWDTDTTYFDGDFNYNIFSAFLQDQLQVGNRLTFVAGLRTDAYSNIKSSLSPRLAIMYKAFEHSKLKIMYGQAFRTPTLNELYYIDPISGYKDNRDLLSEKITTHEAVWEQKLTENLFSTASLYFYKMRNMIDQKIDPVDSLVQNQNLGLIEARGLELSFIYRNQNSINGYLNFSWQNTEDDISESRLSNSPVWLIKNGITIPLHRNWTLGIETQYESSRKTLTGSKTKDFVLNNLTLNSSLSGGKSHFSIRLRNLFDVDHSVPGGYEHIQTQLKQYGRSLIMKVTFQL